MHSINEIGYLEVFAGPMFSGKTDNLLKKCKNLHILSHKKCLFINHIHDIRDCENGHSCHNDNWNGYKLLPYDVNPENPGVYGIKTNYLSEVDVSNYNIIGIDEGQFYPDLLKSIKSWLLQKKHIFVSGLDADSNMEPFGEVLDLMRIADRYNKLYSDCVICCKDNKINPAPFTMRTVSDNSKVLIGNEDKFIPVCRKHHPIFTL